MSEKKELILESSPDTPVNTYIALDKEPKDDKIIPKGRCIEPYDENKVERSKKDEKEINKMKKLFGF